MAASKTSTGAKRKKSGSVTHQTTVPGNDKTVRGGNLLHLLAGLNNSRVILLICLVSCLAYANSLGGQFVYDDTEVIVENKAIRSWDNIGKAFTTHVYMFREQADSLRSPIPPPYYRPVFTVMVTVEYQIFGLWQQGWHLVSLTLHILSSIGLFYVLLMVSRRRLVAAASALLFAVYSIHSESVSWISGMTDPLFSVFFLASFYFYLQYRESSRPKHLIVSLSMFALAALSKETALSLVLFVPAYELIESLTAKSGDQVRAGRKAIGPAIAAALGRTAPFALVVAFYLAARFQVLGGLTWKTRFTHDGPFTDTLLTLPYVILTYLWHLLWPVDLSIAYQTSFVTSISSTKFILPGLILLLIVASVVFYRKRISREVWHALALVFVPLLPVLDLRQLSEQYLVFDRYLYLSTGGFCYLLALAVEKLCELETAQKDSSVSAGNSENAPKPLKSPLRFGFASIVFLLLTVGLTVATARENRNWADHYSLWSNAARIRPTFWAMHYNTGLALMDLKRYPEAIDWLMRAANLAPDEPTVFDALGRACDGAGDTGGAIKNFKRAIEIDSGMFESFNNLGTVHYKLKEYQYAERCFLDALRVKPESVASRFNLGLCYNGEGRYQDAARELEAVVKATTDDPEANLELGLTYEKLGRLSEARNAFERARGLATSQELSDRILQGLSRVQNQRD